MPQENAASTDPALAAEVARAFEQAQSGDGTAVSALQERGPAVIPELEPYVTHADAAVRSSAIALLKGIGGEESIPLLKAALSDIDQDNRQHAVMALYENYPAYDLAEVVGLGPALRRSIAVGNHSAAAILLAGHFPGPEMEATLLTLAGEQDERTELRPASPVVAVSLVARVALSLTGHQPSREALQQDIASGDLQELRFLLEALPHIDAPPVLHALADRTLADERETVSPGPIGAGDPLRLCDEAVMAFGGNFQLDGVTFDSSEARRYSADEIAQVDKAVDELMPR